MIPSQLGPWKVGSELGRGEFSSVYECERIKTDLLDEAGVRWAMKASPFVPPALKKKESKPQVSCRLIGWENQIYSQHVKDHPNFPKRPFRNSYGPEQNGWRFLVIERIQGGTLRHRLEKANGKLRSSDVYSVGLRLLSALKHLHDKEYVFRDLKPENVMTFDPKEDVEGRGVCLVDLGACTKYVDRGKQVTVGADAAGTPLYMSRHVMEAAPPSRRDDLESLGYLMGWLLNGGVLPWSSATSEDEILLMKKDAKHIEAMSARWPVLRRYMDIVLPLKVGSETAAIYTTLEKLLRDEGKGKSTGPIEWMIDDAAGDEVKKPPIKRKSSSAKSESVHEDASSKTPKKRKNEEVIVDQKSNKTRKGKATSSAAAGAAKKNVKKVSSSPMQQDDSEFLVTKRRPSGRPSSLQIEEEEDDEQATPTEEKSKKRKSSSRPMTSKATTKDTEPTSSSSTSRKRRSVSTSPVRERSSTADSSHTTQVGTRRQPSRTAKKMLVEAAALFSIAALVYSTTTK